MLLTVNLVVCFRHQRPPYSEEREASETIYQTSRAIVLNHVIQKLRLSAEETIHTTETLGILQGF